MEVVVVLEDELLKEEREERKISTLDMKSATELVKVFRKTVHASLLYL